MGLGERQQGAGSRKMADVRGKAVVLLSGGLDSAVTALLGRERGWETFGLTFRYGQRHAVEIEASRRVASACGLAGQVVLDIDLRAFGGSALTADIAVPKARKDQELTSEELTSAVPITYVPARNTIFLAFALGYAEVLGSSDIFIGVNALDYSGYPDCRPAFIAAFETLARTATRAGVEGSETRIHAPLMDMTKADIVREGARLGLDFTITHSCYDPSPDGRACGACESCALRRTGFEHAGIPDPTRYRQD